MAYDTFTLNVRDTTFDGRKPTSWWVEVYPLSSNNPKRRLKKILDASGDTRMTGHALATADADDITAGLLQVTDLPDPRDTSLNPTDFGLEVVVHTNYFTSTEIFGATEIAAAISGGVVELEDVSTPDPAAFVASATYAAASDLTTETDARVAADATKMALQQVATTVTASGALVANKHNPVNATSAAKTMTLPTGQAEGTQISVEKTDSSTNTVGINGNIRGVGSTTISLSYLSESLMLRADSAGSWWPVSGHRTKTSLDAAYVRLPASPTDGQLAAWNATTSLWVPVNPSGNGEIAYAENNTTTLTTVGGGGVAVDIANTTVVVPAGTRPVYLGAQCLFKNNSGGTGSSTARALLIIQEVTNGVDTPIQYAGYASFVGAGTTQWVTAHIAPRRLGIPARTRTFKLQGLANIAVTVDNGSVGGSAGAGSSWIAAEAR